MELTNFRIEAIVRGVSACVAALTLSMPAAAQSVLDNVMADGKLTVATEVAYPPMEYLENGKVVGYGKDVLDLVVADMGVDLEQLQLPWDGILAGVLAKKYDLVATSVAIKPDRVKKYAFTRPLAVAQTMLVKRHGDESMSSLSDANGKLVGVELGSSQAQEVEALNADLQANGGAGLAGIRGFKSTDDMRLALASGQIDLGTIPSFSLAAMQGQRPDTYAKLGMIGNGTVFAWVAHPDGADLRDRVNEAIEKLDQAGTLSELQMKWFGFEMEIPEDYLPEGAL
ncbi:MAG: transporter substrate-binding domain-containing protein [Pseudomonadota bacterium]